MSQFRRCFCCDERARNIYSSDDIIILECYTATTLWCFCMVYPVHNANYREHFPQQLCYCINQRPIKTLMRSCRPLFGMHRLSLLTTVLSGFVLPKEGGLHKAAQLRGYLLTVTLRSIHNLFNLSKVSVTFLCSVYF